MHEASQALPPARHCHQQTHDAFLRGPKQKNEMEPGLDNRLADQDVPNSVFEGWLLYGQCLCSSVSFLDTILHNPCGTQGCHTLLNIQTPG